MAALSSFRKPVDMQIRGAERLSHRDPKCRPIGRQLNGSPAYWATIILIERRQLLLRYIIRRAQLDAEIAFATCVVCFKHRVEYLGFRDL